jgi:hypothetical protein
MNSETPWMIADGGVPGSHRAADVRLLAGGVLLANVR